MDNRGFPVPRRITVQSRLSADGKQLYLRLIEADLIGKPKEARAIWNGDSWEIMLSGADKKTFFQLMIPPNGKYLSGMRRPGFEKTDFPGLSVKSVIKDRKWQVDVMIPLAALPFKKIEYGNFFRGGKGLAYAWSPTFEASFGVVERFGKLNLN